MLRSYTAGAPHLRITLRAWVRFGCCSLPARQRIIVGKVGSMTTGPGNGDRGSRPIHRQSKEYVLQVLIDEILSQKLSPGTPLVERALAERFGLSRTPIRQVLWQLEQEQLVTSHANQGMFVRTLTLQDVRNLFQVREAVESLAAQLAAQHRPHDELIELEQAMALLSAEKDPAPDRLSQFGEALHDAIADWSRNKLLLDIYTTLRRQTRLVRSVSRATPNLEAEALSEHRAILDAIRRQDSNEAADCMRKHLMRSSRDLGLVIAGPT